MKNILFLLSLFIITSTEAMNVEHFITTEPRYSNYMSDDYHKKLTDFQAWKAEKLNISGVVYNTNKKPSVFKKILKTVPFFSKL